MVFRVDYVKRSKRLDQIVQSVKGLYPNLAVTGLDNALVQITGEFPVMADGVQVDHYFIRVELPRSYPSVPPLVYETGGRIPKTEERHFHPTTEHACVFVEDDWGWLSLKHPSVGAFLASPVNDFFFWQSCYDYHGKNVLPAWPHGGKGRLEYYREKLGTTDDQDVVRCLRLLSAHRYSANHVCYCGSGRRVHDCHKGIILAMRAKIAPGIAVRALRQIRAAIPSVG